MPAKKSDKKDDDTPTDREREQLVDDAHAELKKAKTATDVRNVWDAYYLKIGHRILGRLLIGQDAASAMRRRKSSNGGD